MIQPEQQQLSAPALKYVQRKDQLKHNLKLFKFERLVQSKLSQKSQILLADSLSKNKPLITGSGSNDKKKYYQNTQSKQKIKQKQEKERTTKILLNFSLQKEINQQKNIQMDNKNNFSNNSIRKDKIQPKSSLQSNQYTQESNPHRVLFSDNSRSSRYQPQIQAHNENQTGPIIQYADQLTYASPYHIIPPPNEEIIDRNSFLDNGRNSMHQPQIQTNYENQAGPIVQDADPHRYGSPYPKLPHSDELPLNYYHEHNENSFPPQTVARQRAMQQLPMQQQDRQQQFMQQQVMQQHPMQQRAMQQQDMQQQFMQQQPMKQQDQQQQFMQQQALEQQSIQQQTMEQLAMQQLAMEQLALQQQAMEQQVMQQQAIQQQNIEQQAYQQQVLQQRALEQQALQQQVLQQQALEQQALQQQALQQHALQQQAFQQQVLQQQALQQQALQQQALQQQALQQQAIQQHTIQQHAIQQQAMQAQQAIQAIQAYQNTPNKDVSDSYPSKNDDRRMIEEKPFKVFEGEIFHNEQEWIDFCHARRISANENINQQNDPNRTRFQSKRKEFIPLPNSERQRISVWDTRNNVFSNHQQNQPIFKDNNFQQIQDNKNTISTFQGAPRVQRSCQEDISPFFQNNNSKNITMEEEIPIQYENPPIPSSSSPFPSQIPNDINNISQLKLRRQTIEETARNRYLQQISETQEESPLIANRNVNPYRQPYNSMPNFVNQTRANNTHLTGQNTNQIEKFETQDTSDQHSERSVASEGLRIARNRMKELKQHESSFLEKKYSIEDKVKEVENILKDIKKEKKFYKGQSEEFRQMLFENSSSQGEEGKNSEEGKESSNSAITAFTNSATSRSQNKKAGNQVEEVDRFSLAGATSKDKSRSFHSPINPDIFRTNSDSLLRGKGESSNQQKRKNSKSIGIQTISSDQQNISKDIQFDERLPQVSPFSIQTKATLEKIWLNNNKRSESLESLYANSSQKAQKQALKAQNLEDFQKQKEIIRDNQRRWRSNGEQVQQQMSQQQQNQDFTVMSVNSNHEQSHLNCAFVHGGEEKEEQSFMNKTLIDSSLRRSIDRENNTNSVYTDRSSIISHKSQPEQSSYIPFFREDIKKLKDNGFSNISPIQNLKQDQVIRDESQDEFFYLNNHDEPASFQNMKPRQVHFQKNENHNNYLVNQDEKIKNSCNGQIDHMASENNSHPLPVSLVSNLNQQEINSNGFGKFTQYNLNYFEISLHQCLSDFGYYANQENRNILNNIIFDVTNGLTRERQQYLNSLQEAQQQPLETGESLNQMIQREQNRFAQHLFQSNDQVADGQGNYSNNIQQQPYQPLDSLAQRIVDEISRISQFSQNNSQHTSYSSEQNIRVDPQNQDVNMSAANQQNLINQQIYNSQNQQEISYQINGANKQEEESRRSEIERLLSCIQEQIHERGSNDDKYILSDLDKSCRLATFSQGQKSSASKINSSLNIENQGFSAQVEEKQNLACQMVKLSEEGSKDASNQSKSIPEAATLSEIHKSQDEIKVDSIQQIESQRQILPSEIVQLSEEGRKNESDQQKVSSESATLSEVKKSKAQRNAESIRQIIDQGYSSQVEEKQNLACEKQQEGENGGKDESHSLKKTLGYSTYTRTVINTAQIKGDSDQNSLSMRISSQVVEINFKEAMSEAIRRGREGHEQMKKSKQEGSRKSKYSAKPENQNEESKETSNDASAAPPPPATKPLQQVQENQSSQRQTRGLRRKMQLLESLKEDSQVSDFSENPSDSENNSNFQGSVSAAAKGRSREKNSQKGTAVSLKLGKNKKLKRK